MTGHVSTEKTKMSLKRIATAAAVFASITLLSVAGAQAATHHHHHHHAAAVAAAADEAIVGGTTVAGYFAPSPWGDFDCQPGFPGCRPYAAKDWSQP
jgi:hypothetical protein